jgi:hypothetical protein
LKNADCAKDRLSIHLRIWKTSKVQNSYVGTSVYIIESKFRILFYGVYLEIYSYLSKLLKPFARILKVSVVNRHSFVDKGYLPTCCHRPCLSPSACLSLGAVNPGKQINDEAFAI